MKLLNQICLFGIRDPIYRREREAPTQALRKLAEEKKSPNFNGVVKRQEQCYKIWSLNKSDRKSGRIIFMMIYEVYVFLKDICSLPPPPPFALPNTLLTFGKMNFCLIFSFLHCVDKFPMWLLTYNQSWEVNWHCCIVTDIFERIVKEKSYCTIQRKENNLCYGIIRPANPIYLNAEVKDFTQFLILSCNYNLCTLDMSLS